VAIVSDFYLDYVGGAQSSIFEQQASLREAGHTALLVAHVRRGSAPVDLPITPRFTVPGVQLAVSYARRPLIDKLKAFFESRHVDVVHLQTDFGLAQAATSAAHELGLPVVHTVHTFYWQSSGVGPTLVAPVMKALLQSATNATFPTTRFTGRPSDDLLRNLTAAMASRADVVVSPSAHQAADLAAAGVASPIVVVPNPIARSPRPAALLSAEATPRFLWVARCEPEKRPLVFAAAVIEALASASFEVDFVGDGSQLDELRAFVHDVPAVRVHGNLGHDAVLDLIDASSMVALTSYGFDNQPMTIAESVSRYRGVLFCDPKLREGLGESGYLSASPDAHGLATSLVELVTTKGLLQKLSAGARQDAVTFSAATYVERVTQVYEQAARA
jgi:glycosyltransferase involved in cell wall biosynthesis